MVRRLPPVLLLGLALALPGAASAGRRPGAAPGRGAEVVVELAPPPAAQAGFGQAGRERRALAALRRIERAQRTVEARIREAVPAARVRWRYRIVLDGLAVVVPPGAARRLERIPGVLAVYPSVRYRPLADGSPGTIGAPTLWGPGLENAGQGVRIGIIDDGIDPAHPLFDPAGLTAPAGFPKGNRAYTTAKVIVARAFPPPDAGWRNAGRPFDPVYSFHGMHVAGIAAGDHETAAARVEARTADTVSGVAPLAYLGNYKALTVPTGGFGLNGNSPELVAAIEAAVADGMDVINLSLGESEVPPSRDVVAKALDNAAAAGVVPVVAAGNGFLELGRGSVGSPGSAARAITVAASDGGRAVASFSSAGPTPLGLAFKPDVSAPGVDVLSAAPGGGYERLSGTSMATPHVAGAAALLVELHPDWTVEQVKSALVLTGRPLGAPGHEDASTREGGGLVDLPAAADPLVTASPQSLAFGLLDAGDGPLTAEQGVSLADAGGGAGTWAVAVEEQAPAGGSSIELPASVDVPGELRVRVAVSAGAREGEHAGFVVLERDGVRRRIPFWYRVTRPQLESEAARVLRGPGLYSGDTSGRPARVDTYRYPDAPSPVRRRLPGPEQVFRFTLGRPVANFGVAVVRSGRGVEVEPRIVGGADENRLLGDPALPFVDNPYLDSFFSPTPVAAALFPTPGPYSIVFDTPGAARAGPFAFRLWVDDVTPPRVELVSRTARDGQILARVRDAGSGVDPGSIVYTVDGRRRSGRFDARRGIAVLDVSFARPGAHRLVLSVADRQEAKNNENVGRILPNTRVLTVAIRVP